MFGSVPGPLIVGNPHMDHIISCKGYLVATGIGSQGELPQARCDDLRRRPLVDPLCIGNLWALSPSHFVVTYMYVYVHVYDCIYINICNVYSYYLFTCFIFLVFCSSGCSVYWRLVQASTHLRLGRVQNATVFLGVLCAGPLGTRRTQDLMLGFPSLVKQLRHGKTACLM